jgi:hypothetical protein
MKLKDVIQGHPPDLADQYLFAEAARDWLSFNKALKEMDLLKVVKLLNFLTEHRHNSRALIQRAVQRYNFLNRASIDDVM